VIAGRATYEAAGHWGDKNPWGIPVFVVTHRPGEQPPGDDFTFVGSLAEAIDRAKAAAGDKQVHVMGGADLIRQAWRPAWSTNSSSSGCASPGSRPSSTTAWRSDWRACRDGGVVMPRLIYSALASADGYVEDAGGGFDWAAPDEEVLRFVNDLERPVGTYLYGRRMYQTMLYWESADSLPGQPSAVRDFTELWRAADKIVFSRTLESVPSARTRLERDFDPGMIAKLKSAADLDMTVGGADLAGQAMAAGLVDELQLLLVPAIVGGGKPALPSGVRFGLELLDTHRFGNGTVYLRYRLPRPAGSP